LKRIITISILAITLASACSESQTTDHYSYLFNCDDFMNRLRQKDAYSVDRQVECDAAKGKTSKEFRNISAARFRVAQSYASFGESYLAAQMYEASVFALAIAGSWKNKGVCSSAAMAAGELASLSNISPDERTEYAKLAAYWGNQNGTYFYALYLERGEGTLRDLVSAYAWYNVTAAYAGGARSGAAQEALGRLDSVLPVQTRIEAQSLSKAIQADIKSRQGCKYMVGN
jgi:hypothetical protein